MEKSPLGRDHEIRAQCSHLSIGSIEHYSLNRSEQRHVSEAVGGQSPQCGVQDGGKFTESCLSLVSKPNC